MTDLETTPDLAPSSETLMHAAEVARLLADGTRLAILATLRGGVEKSVTTLAEELGRPTPGVSQHLAKLRAGRLVGSRRDGTTIRYSLTNEHVDLLVTNVLLHSEHLAYEIPPHHR
ncbi:metalloregulator ArsR/SmtB family transcription factor [Cellulomonas sp. ACRRI]|uniref:ArsR/SmtB family transcription factor n=1 Tax=Cellulomonas sp. ACRRI TaxID=2918188 RepID=UPI001EF2ACCC|nr:metalloregulator ArsR/SmtB family transcription factor [Cellulomonas sp. ACRRI]MCG7284769.1 metalloregulator ArsR/SmtB family transcription factor [Cellulomonas sp. ACRRI]